MSMQHSLISSNNNSTQAFINLEQGLDELFDDYFHSVNKLPSKTYQTFDMSSISAEGTNHYTVVYHLNCRKLKDSITGH